MQHLGRTLAGFSLLTMAGCAQPASISRDTGSMATPAPSATGAMNRAAIGSGPAAATGNMAYPAPVTGSGTLTPAPLGRDSGSMAIPDSSMGNLRQAPRAY